MVTKDGANYNMLWVKKISIDHQNNIKQQTHKISHNSFWKLMDFTLDRCIKAKNKQSWNLE